MRLIDANQLLKKTHNYYPSIDHYCCSRKVVELRDIDEAPTIEAEPVKHGRWIILGQRTYGSGSGRNYTHYCSECGQHGFGDYNRCPNCGCKMDLEET